MQNSDIRKVIDEINNDVYYEKLGNMVMKLQNWLKQKDILISQCFVNKTEVIVAEAVRRQDKIVMYYQVFAEFLAQIEEYFPKAVSETSPNKKQSKKNTGVLIKRKSSITKQPPTLPLLKLKQIWSARKQGFHKLQSFSQTIINTLLKHTEQNNKNISQLKAQGKKIQNNSQWPISQYSKKFQLSVVKKNQKQFEIGKIKEAYHMFIGECKEHEEAYGRLLEMHGRVIEGQYFMAESFYSQIVAFNQIINQCLVGFNDTLIKQSAKFLQDLKIQNKYMYQQLQQSAKFRQQSIEHLKQSLDKINNEALQQIEITSWPISSKSISQKCYTSKKGILTLDNKFLIIEVQKNQGQNKIVEAEINLLDAVVNETENIGEVVLKLSKKISRSQKRGDSSKKVMVKFQKPQNQDQFFLHIQRVKGQIH